MTRLDLLFVKAKVYLHPKKTKKDNVAGFLCIGKPLGQCTSKDYILQFCPERNLSSAELTKYKDADMTAPVAPENATKYSIVGSGDSEYAYELLVTLSQIYSLQLRKPLLGWWYGSIVVNTKGGGSTILFFHDDESPLTLKKQKMKNQLFDPFGEHGDLYWGGQDFLAALKLFIPVVQSSVDSLVYLVDASSDDLRNFAPPRADVVQDTNFLPDFSKVLATAKWRILETVASLGAKTKNNVLDIVDEHVPPIVRTLAGKAQVKRISDEFDSAHVYLARWAAQVKEEAELSLKKLNFDELHSRIDRELGPNGILTAEEASRATRREPISLVEWEGFFDAQGRLSVTVFEVKSRIFHGGLEPEARPSAWLFLLGVFEWDSSALDREQSSIVMKASYESLRELWACDEAKRNTNFWQDQKVRIEKDVHRIDRHLEIFGTGEDCDADDGDFKNPHLNAMREILLTFNELNTNLGYIQGMTDLLLPLYVILRDKAIVFYAFVKFMERMERNFVRDQSGIRKQMVVLNDVVRLMLPKMFTHLERCESNDLFFFFRMLLVWFKRELDWNDTLTLWEALWTDLYSSQQHIFFALAVLSDNERIMIQNLRRLDEVLKYMNDLSGRLRVEDLLVRSELLVLRFRRTLEIIDRDNARRRNNGEKEVEISDDVRQLASRKIVIQKEIERPPNVGGG